MSSFTVYSAVGYDPPVISVRKDGRPFRCWHCNERLGKHEEVKVNLALTGVYSHEDGQSYYSGVPVHALCMMKGRHE